MVTCQPFVPTDLHALWALKGQAPPVPPGQAETSVAVTIADAQGPCCCFGVQTVWPGLGIAWFEERDQATMRQHAYVIGRAFKRTWDEGLRQGQYRRVECYVPATHKPAQRLACWVGFVLVATKPFYGRNGETILEYVYYPGGTPCVPG